MKCVTYAETSYNRRVRCAGRSRERNQWFTAFDAKGTLMKCHSTVSKLAEMLCLFGVPVCFGVTGTANFEITLALAERGVKFVPSMHESNAVMMACGYSRSTGQLALASVHSGPGLTNALTAIAEAAKSGAPLLILAGEVATGDIGNNFYFQQAEMARSVGAEAERIYTPASALGDLSRALRKVLRDRKTVVLSLPVDVQRAAYVESDELPRTKALLTRNAFSAARSAPDPSSVEILADLVLQSERPVIIAGRGAVISNAETSLSKLGEQVGALFATSLQAHGLFSSSPWCVGISGGFSNPAALELLPDSDLILGFGLAFTHWTIRQGRLINPTAIIAQVDCEIDRMPPHGPASVTVLGDADLTAKALHDELIDRDVSNRTGWRTKRTETIIEEMRRHQIPAEASDGPDFIDPRLLSSAIDKILPKDRVVITDSGHFMGWPPLYLTPPDEIGWFMPTAFQSVGLALGAAIGAGMAQPRRLTVAAVGDGGLMMSMSDFATAVTSGLSMCVVVYNDSAYGAEVHEFKHKGYDVSIARFPTYDFAAIAKGYGAEAIVVKCVRDLDGLEKWVRDGAHGLFLVDARVDPTVEAEWFRDAFVKPSILKKER
jgi:thiamine pyrophosphate-dependent acetolactate synthase large subunit-like protein